MFGHDGRRPAGAALAHSRLPGPTPRTGPRPYQPPRSSRCRNPTRPHRASRAKSACLESQSLVEFLAHQSPEQPGTQPWRHFIRGFFLLITYTRPRRRTTRQFLSRTLAERRLLRTLMAYC
jgi:hypothetical protein